MVSVIIPLYNAKSYIIDAVTSALKQMYVKELIVIDDQSTDGSFELIRDWMDANRDRYGNIEMQLLRNSGNLGVAGTRNRGVSLAQGTYVAFLDADDRFAPTKIEKQIRLLEQTGAPLCNTARVLMKADGSLTETIIHTPEKMTLSDLEKTNPINCSSVVVRKDVMTQFPMEHSEIHEDYLTWLRMLHTYEYVVGIDEPLLQYRLSENGKSRNKLKSACMTYRTYRYAGYPVWKACRMFCSYMVNGFRKYKSH